MPLPLAQFYWRWIKVAWAPSWSASDWIASALGMLLPALIRIIGISETTTEDLTWQVPIGALIVLVAARLVLAPYLMYKEDQKRVCEMKEALEKQISLNKPLLSGEMQLAIWGTDKFSDADECTVVMSLTIRNRGEPSIVEGWKVSAVMADGRPIDGMMLVKEGGIVVSDGSGGTRTITKQDMIFGKAMTPIPKGGAVSGWLAVLFRGHSFQQLDQTNAIVLVEFRDIEGTRYECKSGHSAPPYGLNTYFPGDLSR